MNANTTHPFEAQGLGKAPFTFHGIISIPHPSMAAENPEGYRNAMKSLPKDIGYCHYCGMVLTHNFIIHSQDGKVFYVGCECVRKTGDQSLTNACLDAEKGRQKSIRKERKEENLRKKEEARQVSLQIARDAFIKKHDCQDLINFINQNPQENYFIQSLKEAFNKWASLSDNQMVALRKSYQEYKNPIISSHQGTPGERLDLSLTLERTFSFPSYYGTTFINKLQDPQGNVFILRTSKNYSLSPGTTYNITATIKEHDTYKGIQQTIIQRIKIHDVTIP